MIEQQTFIRSVLETGRADVVSTEGPLPVYHLLVIFSLGREEAWFSLPLFTRELMQGTTFLTS